MSTYTIAQALATNATGIVVLDTGANIATALPNASLVSRVSVFDLSATASIAAWQATNLASLGGAFSLNGFKLTVRDSVASLTNPAYATGIALSGAAIAVFDTAANILAGASNSIIRNAGSIALSANATLTLSQLLILETWPSFTAAGLTLTLADSAANLLALTTPEQKPSLTVFQVSISSTVTAANALTLGAMSHFSVVGATLTIGDTIANLTTNASALAAMMALSGVVEVVADTVSNLLGQTSALTALEVTMPHLTVSLAGNDMATVAQLALLAALPGFRAGTGNTLTAADNVQNLLTLTAPQKALIQATALSGNGTANATQIAQLAGLPSFARGSGHTLVVTDTLANLVALTAAQTALASSTAVDDTLTNVVAAQTAHSTILAAAGAVTVELDGTGISAAQLTALQTLPGFTLHANVTSSTLTIVDTVTDLLGLTLAQKALIQATTLSASGTANATQLPQLAALPSFSRGSGHTLVVTDTLANLAALTTPQRALASSSTVDDTVTNILAAQTAHSTVLSAASSVTAELDGNNISVAQLASLQTLPGITLHANVTSSTLTIADTVVDLLTLTLAEKALIQATTLVGNDTANAAQLTQLAALPSFTRGSSHNLVAADTIANLAALTVAQRALTTSTAVDDTLTNILAAQTAHSTTLSAAGAVTVELDGTNVTIAQGQSLLLLPGLKLHANGGNTSLVVADTIQDLAAGASTLTALATDGPVTELVTNNDAILTASAAAGLTALSGFNAANYVLAISDTGTALTTYASQVFGKGFEAIIVSSGAFSGTLSQLLDPSLRVLGGATAQLNANTIATAAQAISLAAIPGFIAGDLSASDTPAALATITLAVASFLSGATLATETGGNTAAYTVTAAQMATVLGLPNFSMSAFTGTVTVMDTAAAMAAFAPTVEALSSGVRTHIVSMLSGDATVSATTATVLAGLPNPTNGGHVLTVDDTPTALLAAANAAGVALGSVVGVSTAVAISVSTAGQLAALHGFAADAYAITIADTAANLSTLSAADAALATSIQILGSPDVSVNQYDALVAASGILSGSNTVVIADTAANLLALVGQTLTHVSSAMVQPSSSVSAEQAQSLSTLANLLTGNNLTISDSVADLVQTTDGGTQPIDAAGEQLASQVTMNGDGTISVAQGAMLASLGARFSNGNFHLVLEDTPANLITAATSLGAIMSQVTSTVLSSNGGTPWIVTLSQAAQLANLPTLSPGVSGVVVQDNATDILYPGNAAIVSEVPSITLNGNATGNSSVNVAQAEALHALSNFSLGGFQLNILDGAGHLATLDAGTAAMATSIQLQGSALVTVAQFVAIRNLPATYTDNGKLLVVNDTAGNLEGLTGSLSLASEIMLSTSIGSLPAATAEQLASLPNFTTGIAHMAVVDTAADLVAGGGSTPTDWAGEMAATSVTLSASSIAITAAQADDLALLGGRFSNGGNALTVQDTIANLVANANGAGVALATAVTLKQPETGVSIANWAWVSALPGFTKGIYTVGIGDTAAAIAAANPSLLAQADTVQLSSAAMLTVAAAESLVGIGNFVANAAAPITIADTLPDLLLLHGNSNAILTAAPIELSANALVTVAQLATLAMLQQYSTFSAGGFAITVEDSGAHLAAYTPGSIAVPTFYVMIGDATLTQTQGNALVQENVSIGDNHLTIAADPTTLLSLGASLNALATGLTLSGASSATTTQAIALAQDGRFTTGGDAFTVTGSAAALLSFNSSYPLLATTLGLSETGDIIHASDLQSLAELGTKFALAGNTMTVTDTAASLAALNSFETALVHAEVLQDSESVNATIGAALGALPNFSLGSAVTLTVTGTYAELTALPALIQSIATLELTGGSGSPLTAEQAATLAALSNFSPAANVVVQDTIGDLTSVANTGWPGAATGGYIVTDSVSNLLGNINSSLLSAANSVTLLGDAEVDASDFAALAGLTNFSRGTAALVVQDSAAAIAADATSIAAVASSALVDSAAPVSAAAAEALAGLNTLHMLNFAGGVSLAVQDAFSTIQTGSYTAGLALAHTITAQGSATDLVTATSFTWPGTAIVYYELTSGGNIFAQTAVTLHSLGSKYSPNGNTLTVVDNSSDAVGATTAIQALGLAVQVNDTVAGVDAATAGLLALGTTLQSIALTDMTAVQAAPAAALVPLLGKLIGSPIAVSDTALAVDGNLAALQTLGAHISSITVNDSVVNLAPYAAALSVLGSELLISLTGMPPFSVHANIAADLVPLVAQLAGVTINVLDTGAAIGAAAATLADLTELGTITLSDGPIVTAAIATELQPIDAHLGLGVTLNVADSAAAIAGAATSLGLLSDDGKLGTVTAAAQLAADIVTYGATLATLGATATIDDSAEHVSTYLDALEPFAGGLLTGITLNDNADISVSIGQFTTDANVLALIGGSFKYAISDSSAQIANDLGAGGLSNILNLGAQVHTITVTGGTLSLDAGTLLATGVDAALANLAGGTQIAATGVTIGDFTDIDLLAIQPDSFAV
ncbi:MAG TPA: hypothetical protein VGG99_00460, partial [Acetobacteraceae bacterium]